MAKLRLRHVNAFRNRKRRDGRLRYYFRRRGQKAIPLPGLPGSEEFIAAYGMALAALPDQPEIGASRTSPGTVNALVIDYYRSTEWHDLSEETRKTRRRIIERFRVKHGDKRQRAFALAAKVGASRGPEGAGVRTGPASHGPPRGPERRFEARGGRLVGRPDYYDGHILTEYKSSLPDAAWPGAAEIVESFRRQLRLYAVIVADALGTWPASGRVVAASGQALEFKIDAAACNAEADAALAELDTLNGALNVGAAPEDLAAPGVSACAGCPFQIICPAFWQQLGHGNLEVYIDAALEGVLERLEPGPDNDLYTAYVTARSASLHLSREQAVVLRKSVHGALVLSDVGASCRLAGGRVRPDGQLGADFSTVVLAVSSLLGLENSLHQTATAAPLA
jgi:hypothetical protein